MQNSFNFGNNQNQIFFNKSQKLYDHINNYISFYKRYPSRKYLASYMNQSEPELLKHLDYLVENKKMAKKNGDYYIPGIENKESLESKKMEEQKKEPEIIPINNDIPETKVIEKKEVILEITPPIVKPEIKQADPKIETQREPTIKSLGQNVKKQHRQFRQNPKKRSWELIIIKIILTLMLITSVLIEMNYNIENFILMMGTIKGWLTGIAMVLYDCIAFSLIIYVWKMRLKFRGYIENSLSYQIKSLITKIFVSTLLFCLFAGVFYTLQINIMHGLFEKYQDQLFEKKEKFENKDLILLDRYEKEEKELEKEINLRIINRDKLQEKFIGIEDIESKEYRNLNWRIILANQEIDKRRKELQDKRTDIETIYKRNNKTIMQVKQGFFDLISLNIFKGKIKPNWLQIIQVFFPALIFNLISSASMGLILFLKE